MHLKIQFEFNKTNKSPSQLSTSMTLDFHHLLTREKHCLAISYLKQVGWMSRPQGGSGKWGLFGASTFTNFLPFFFLGKIKKKNLTKTWGGAKSPQMFSHSFWSTKTNWKENLKKSKENLKKSRSKIPLVEWLLCSIGRCGSATIRPQGHFGQNLHNEITYNCPNQKVPNNNRNTIFIIITRLDALGRQKGRLVCGR